MARSRSRERSADRRERRREDPAERDHISKRKASPDRDRDREPKRSRQRSNSKERSRRPRSRSRDAGRKPLDYNARQAAKTDGVDRDKPARRSHRGDSAEPSARRQAENGRSDKDRARDRDNAGHRDRDRQGTERDRTRDKATDRSSDRRLSNDRAEASAADNTNGAAPGQAARKEPLSLEELLRKRQEEQAQLAKPKFLSKKEREALALKRREEEAAIQKQRLEELRKGHDAYLSTAQQDKLREQKRQEERQRELDRQHRQQERERQLQAELIKQQYLGGEKQKKKMLKPSEKFKFNFDWEAQDDTSKDVNPLYNNTHQAMLLFGRGMRAGVDRREQMKAAAEYQRKVQAEFRAGQGIAETAEDRQRDRERARMADKFEDMRKDRHWSEKKREDMTERDWRIFREDFNIAYKGSNASLPIRNWEEAGLPDSLMKAIEKQGYKKPSPIQMAAIPLGLQQRDVIGVAETGSGKTAAFTLPMLVYIMNQPKMTEEIAQNGPYAVVMAPTRELAQQIEEEAVKMAQFTDYRIVSVVGGQSIEEQGFKLRKGCEIVIATPGRLGDCLEKSYAVLNQCNYVVLDEADRMIDMGFEPQVMAVLDAMPSSNLKPEDESVGLDSDKVYRTTYMFSATMPTSVERLARKYLRRPVVVNIGSAGRATDNVTQRVLMVKDNEKPNLLDNELRHVDDKRVIVFVNTKKQCDAVQRHLEPQSYRCAVLHGGKDQNQREASLAGFREEKYNVLIATDVAGRGIDVPDVALVINYDMPATVEAYTHRIGRTGRAGRKGVAITFLTPNDSETFYDLKKLLEDSNATVPSALAHHEASKVKPGALDAPRRRDQVVYSNK